MNPVPHGQLKVDGYTNSPVVCHRLAEWLLEQTSGGRLAQAGLPRSSGPGPRPEGS